MEKSFINPIFNRIIYGKKSLNFALKNPQSKINKQTCLSLRSLFELYIGSVKQNKKNQTDKSVKANLKMCKQKFALANRFQNKPKQTQRNKSPQKIRGKLLENVTSQRNFFLHPIRSFPPFLLTDFPAFLW